MREGVSGRKSVLQEGHLQHIDTTVINDTVHNKQTTFEKKKTKRPGPCVPINEATRKTLLQVYTHLQLACSPLPLRLLSLPAIFAAPVCGSLLLQTIC